MPGLDLAARYRPTQPYPLAQSQGALRYFVIFRIDRQSYALPLEHVTRALRMVALTPIPDAAEGMLGMINMAGHVIPVIDLRARLGHPPRAPDINDRLLIVDVSQQTLAFVADAVLDVLELALRQVSPPPLALAQSQPLAATIQQADELILVLDAMRLLPAFREKTVP